MGMGMGSLCGEQAKPIPHPTSPLKGEEPDGGIVANLGLDPALT